MSGRWEGELHIGDGRGWTFFGGPSGHPEGGPRGHPKGGAWTERDGLIEPPDARVDLHQAFLNGADLSDLTATFEFRVGSMIADARFFFRAADCRTYYSLDFPFVGQAARAKFSWSAVSKGDGSGYDDYLHLSLVPRASPEVGRWHAARLVARGGVIRSWVDGQELPAVRDRSFAHGAIGLGAVGPVAFRSVRITGSRAPRTWNPQVAQARPWFFPFADLPDPAYTGMPQLCRTGSGDLLALVPIRAPGLATRFFTLRLQHGRAWDDVREHAFEETLFGLRCKRDGSLSLLFLRDCTLSAYESRDHGDTWSGPRPLRIGVFPAEPATLHPYGPLCISPRGALVQFLYGGLSYPGQRDVRTWGSLACQAFCIRSTDDGETWSAPVNLDGLTPPLDGSHDLTEPAGAFVSESRLFALIRPIYGSHMWETWSEDGGATWGPTRLGPFPGYAPSCYRTSRGVLVFGHRFPGHTLHLSRDDGATWTAGTRMDSAIAAMAVIAEVEPDRLLVLYAGNCMAGGMGTEDPGYRAQFVRITPDGPRPG